jgi:hypothetical protein
LIALRAVTIASRADSIAANKAFIEVSILRQTDC